MTHTTLLTRIALLSGLAIGCGEKTPTEPPSEVATPEPPPATSERTPEPIPEVGEGDPPETTLPPGAAVCLTIEEVETATGVAGECPPHLDHASEEVAAILPPMANPGNLSLDAKLSRMDAYSDAIRCCYEVVFTAPPMPTPRKGRPMLVDGVVQRPTMRVNGASPADRWREDARYERSSVSAFLRAAAELRAVRAPASLVQRCLDAAADEARHADACLETATALDGEIVPMGPAPAVAPRGLDLVSLAVSTLVEGAIPETLAAAEARVAAARCDNPRIRAVLETIAADEQRHADLGWAIIGWARARGGSAVDEALTRAFTIPAPAEEADVPEAGRLGTAQRAALYAELGDILNRVHQALEAA